MAGRWDPEFRNNADWIRTLTYEDPAGTPVDLTGYSAKMQLRTSKSSPTVVFELSTVIGNIVLGGALGTIELTITETELAAIEECSGSYDLLLTDAGGIICALLEGMWTLEKGTTVP